MTEHERSTRMRKSMGAIEQAQLGQVVDSEILLVIGVNRPGQRVVLGGSVAPCEPEVRWQELMRA